MLPYLLAQLVRATRAIDEPSGRGSTLWICHRLAADKEDLMIPRLQRVFVTRLLALGFIVRLAPLAANDDGSDGAINGLAPDLSELNDAERRDLDDDAELEPQMTVATAGGDGVRPGDGSRD